MSLAFLQSLGGDDLVDKNTIRSAPSTYRTAMTNNSEKQSVTTNSAPENATVDTKQPDGGSRFLESESVRQAPLAAPLAQSPTSLTNAESPKAIDYAAASPPPQDMKVNGHNASDGNALSTHGSVAPSEPPVSYHTAPEDRTVRPGPDNDSPSIRSASIRTGAPSEIPPSAVGAFATGAATSGPRAAPDPDLHSRATIAESNVGGDILRRLTQREAKDAKRFSKILKKEAVTEQRTLDVALKELERLQKVQRKAAAAEAEALAKHTKASRQENKLNQIYLSAKTKWEQSAAYLKSCTEALEESRNHAKHETEVLREKTAEVDRLRAQKATDDRERHAKIAALSSPGR